jgi:hypothetical protein
MGFEQYCIDVVNKKKEKKKKWRKDDDCGG